MRFVKRFRWFIITVTFVVCIGGVYSCTQTTTNVFQDRTYRLRELDIHDIQKFYVGMPHEKVLEYCGGFPLTDNPYILRYPSSEDGINYIFYFIPTNEVEWPNKPEGNTVSLLALTRKDWKMREELYILPTHVKGIPFTGVKDIDQW